MDPSDTITAAQTPHAAGPQHPQIALIGAYPPPYGGVSGHLARLFERLTQAGISAVLFNTVSNVEQPPHIRSVAGRRARWFPWFCFTHRFPLVHLQTTHFGSQIVFGLSARLRGCQHVMTLHNMLIPELIDNTRSVRAKLMRWALRQVDCIIAVNAIIAESCIEMADVRPERIRVIPAFIPPDEHTAPPLPADAQSHVDNHNPILSACVWLKRIHHGVSLYGTDMIIDLVERLQARHPRIGVILALLDNDAATTDTLEREASRRVGNAILFRRGGFTDMTRLLQVSDVFLRPTNTDGDANSVREALALGTPVVASDAVPRPLPCVLFPSRDVSRFVDAVEEVLDKLPEIREKTAAWRGGDPGADVLALYRELGMFTR